MNCSIGEFSRLTGLSKDTIRYYEKEQLIFVKRDASGRRSFTEEDFTWISFIKRLKETGMPIKDIKKYAKLRYTGDTTIQERLDILQKHREFALAEKEKWEANVMHLDAKIKIYKDLLKNN